MAVHAVYFCYFKVLDLTGRVGLCTRLYTRVYCTTQHSPEIEICNRLPAPPWRLDLTQMVLMTTGMWGALGAAPKPGLAYAGFATRPQSAAPRAGSPAKLYGFQIKKFENRALENHQNASYAEFNSG